MHFRSEGEQRQEGGPLNMNSEEPVLFPICAWNALWS